MASWSGDETDDFVGRGFGVGGVGLIEIGIVGRGYGNGVLEGEIFAGEGFVVVGPAAEIGITWDVVAI